MAHKRIDKKKAPFFGDHLEIKPAFMQKPKSLDEVMLAAFSPQILNNTSSLENSATEADSATGAQQPAVAIESTQEIRATAVNYATVAENSDTNDVIPLRLAEDLNRLQKLNREEWQSLSINDAIGPDYWRGYALAWHYLEDEILPYLEKDLKLSLRRCYRKAFGEANPSGRFFAGQTALAKEVGLSKRRIQDILEIFHLLGWVKKVAHFNRGGRKGTEYEMQLPVSAINLFSLKSF